MAGTFSLSEPTIDPPPWYSMWCLRGVGVCCVFHVSIYIPASAFFQGILPASPLLFPRYNPPMQCQPGLDCHWATSSGFTIRIPKALSLGNPDTIKPPDAVAFHLPKTPRPPPEFSGTDVLTIGASMESTQMYPHQAEAWEHFDIVMALSPHSDVPLHYLGMGDQLRGEGGQNLSLEGVERGRGPGK